VMRESVEIIKGVLKGDALNIKVRYSPPPSCIESDGRRRHAASGCSVDIDDEF